MTKKKRNPIAKELHEDKEDVYRIRIVESKKRKVKKLKPKDILRLTEEEMEDYE